MASKLTTRTSTKSDRKAGAVRQVAPPTNGHQPTSDLAHTCSCSCGRTWAPRAAKPAHACGCEPGCEATTRRTYAQGHDAKALAFVRKLHAQGDEAKTKAEKARVTHLREKGLYNDLVLHLS